MDQEEQRYVVKFEVSGIPDRAGLRIKSTDPVGIWVSGKDARAAQMHFEAAALELLIKRDIAPAGSVLTLVHHAAWEEAMQRGRGEIIIRTLKTDELPQYQEMRSRGESFTTQEMAPEMLTDWLDDGNGKAYCVIRSADGSDDEWLLDHLEEDTHREYLN